MYESEYERKMCGINSSLHQRVKCRQHPRISPPLSVSDQLPRLFLRCQPLCHHNFIFPAVNWELVNRAQRGGWQIKRAWRKEEGEKWSLGSSLLHTSIRRSHRGALAPRCGCCRAGLIGRRGRAVVRRGSALAMGWFGVPFFFFFFCGKKREGEGGTFVCVLQVLLPKCR
ncbi:hypothetical protein B0J12DRAFT_100964 [Macrophomina phaseolina]|uniref:Uncharacterized protein n=1 Tax=Macrophomina phaseolina TaxID=35725 RepID=A0ABQ8G9R5_9PEZI|nr:hypothetical protein B0J12DRAFT_100964 [Macrophomina phaseolina]